MARRQDPRVLTEKMYEEGVIKTPDAKAAPWIKYEETPRLPGDFDRLQEAMWGRPAETLTKEERGVVHIPGVSDVIHAWPKAKPSEQEAEAHRIMTAKSPPVPTFAANLTYYEQRKAAGVPLPSPLKQDQLDYIKERRERIKALRESPSPQIVKSIGTVMTWFDDRGDSMTAAYWGGRGGVWLAAKIGLKIATRAVPYLGWALLAKDVFDIVNVMRLSKLLGRNLKRHKWTSDGINPFGKKAKTARLAKMAKKFPPVAAWIEIAQTTDTYFGVGISFGPLVGLATDAVFGLLKGAEWKPPARALRSVDEVQAHGVSGGAWIGTFGQEFSVADHMEANAAVAAGLDTWGWRAPRRLDYGLENKVFEQAVTPPPVSEPATRIALEEEGIDPDRVEPWPVPGSPEKMTGMEMMTHIQKVAPGNMEHWLKPLSKDFRSLVAGETIDSIAMSGLEKIAGEPLEWEITQAPTQRVYQRLMEGLAEWPEGTSEEGGLAYVAAMIKGEEEGLTVFEQIQNAKAAAAAAG
ncbi:MAG: hypothetical protein Q8N61_01375 [bacterium]|nr:hypothetical protein [bacterium]